MRSYIKNIWIIIALLLVGNAFAQQDAQYTNFMFNKLVINPAAAGSENMLSSSVFYRSQWAGLNPNPIAPVTQTLSIHSPIGKKNGKKSGGLGLNVVNDRVGFQRNLNVTASASYLIDFRQVSFYGRKEKRLFMGMQGGFRQYRLDVTQLDPEDSNDEVIPELDQNVMLPEIGVGFLYKTDGFYLGVSIPHLVQTKIRYTDYQNLASKQVRHYYAMLGYEYELVDDFVLKPNVLMKYALNAPIEFDVNALVEYKKMVWAGVGVRTRDAVGFLVGVNFGQISSSFEEQIKLGYSFDHTVSKIPTYNKGSHEIFLIYDISLGKKTLRPKFIG